MKTYELDQDQIAGIIQLIDVCSKRGAFEGSELQNVGALRNLLVEKIQPPEETETVETP